MKILLIIVGVLLLLAVLWFVMSLAYFLYLSLPYDEWAEMENKISAREKRHKQ